MIKTIRAKLILGLASLTLLGMGTSALGLNNARQIHSASQANENTHSVLQSISSLRESLTSIETGQRGFLVTGQPSYLEPYYRGKEEISQHFDTSMFLISDNPEQGERLSDVKRRYFAWLERSIDPSISLKRQQNNGSISADEFTERFMALSGKAAMDEIRSLLGEVEQAERLLLEQRNRASEQAYKTALWSVAVSAGIVLTLALLITVGLGRLINNKLKQLGQQIALLEQGDFRVDEQGHPAAKGAGNKQAGQDEIDHVLAALARARSQLQGVISQIKDQASGLSVQAEQIGASSEQLENSSQQQAQASAAMASSVEELTVSIEQIAENSGEAHQTAQAAQAGAASSMGTLNAVMQNIEHIATAVRNSATSIDQLKKQSDQIGDIVSAITEIADRTNLLALNAAIEAARAGESGRGFAVVADEVRQLAEQTKGSTDKISNMIFEIQRLTEGAVGHMKHSVELVELGQQETKAVNQTIDLIGTQAEQVATAVQGITQAMREQSQVSVEMSQGVERIAQMTEENTRSASQNRSVAQALQSVSSELLGAVKTFKT